MSRSLQFYISLVLIIPGLFSCTPSDTGTTSLTATSGSNKLILNDDYDNPSKSAQALFSEKTMTYTCANGEGKLTALSKGIMPAMYPEDIPADFTAEMEFRADSAQSGNGYGIVYRAQRVNNGLSAYYMINIAPTDSIVSFGCWKTPGWIKFENYPIKPGTMKTGEKNRLQLEVVGSKSKASLNNNLLFETTEPTLSAPGLFGIVIANSKTDKPDTAYFDNLRIYSK